MVADKINELKEELEKQILKNESYDKIYNTSQKIDDLITKYYKNNKLAKRI